MKYGSCKVFTTSVENLSKNRNKKYYTTISEGQSCYPSLGKNYLPLHSMFPPPFHGRNFAAMFQLLLHMKDPCSRKSKILPLQFSHHQLELSRVMRGKAPGSPEPHNCSKSKSNNKQNLKRKNHFSQTVTFSERLRRSSGREN